MEPVLRVKDVSVWFGGLAALRNVSLRVDPGECLGIIGSNGAGKSTLVDVICGARAPDGGTVSMAAGPLPQEGPRARTLRGLSRTFQGLRLFSNLTALDNILVRAEALKVPNPMRKATRVLEELDLLKIADIQAAALPLAFQKSVAVGQALVTDPKLTILDEPLAGLDQHGVQMVQDLIRTRLSGSDHSIVLIDHNVAAVAEVAQRVVFMHNGEALLAGPTADVLRSAEVSELYFGRTQRT